MIQHDRKKKPSKKSKQIDKQSGQHEFNAITISRLGDENHNRNIITIHNPDEKRTQLSSLSIL